MTFPLAVFYYAILLTFNMSLERNGYEVPASIEPVIGFFAGITEIPRPSGNEGAIRDHLMAFAAERGFEMRVDERGNLAFDVPASSGMENKLRVVLQGHMDMVTVPGRNDIAPTKAYIDSEGWMRAKGTTLGADNGMGVATAMALSDDKELNHGPLTVLITVHEESLPMGAQELDPEIIPADAAFLINLDSEEGAGFICRGCAASCDIEGIFEIGEREGLPAGYTVVALSLKGLLGGHSGVDIHRGRGNAIKLLNELLTRIDLLGTSGDGSFMKLIKYAGGTRRNVIPSTAEALIAIPYERLEEVKGLVENFVRSAKSDDGAVEVEKSGGLVAANAQGLSVDMLELSMIFGDAAAVSDGVKERVMTAIELLEVGPMDTVEDPFTGGVLLSNNLGILREHEDGGDGAYFQLSSMARGAQVDELMAKREELRATLENGAFADRVEIGRAGGAWLEDMNSPAIQTAAEVARELSLPPTVFAYHAGLEAAYIPERLKERAPGLSAVSLGPKIVDAHSDQERVHLASVVQTHAFIRRMLERIAT